MSPVRGGPSELWEQAGGDREKYLELMREHGHLVEGKRREGEDIFGHWQPQHSMECKTIGGGPGHDTCLCWCHGTAPKPEPPSWVRSGRHG